MRVESGSDAAHQNEITGRRAPEVKGLSLAAIWDEQGAFPCRRCEEQSGMAPMDVDGVDGGGNGAEKFVSEVRDAWGGFDADRSWEQRKVNRSAGASDERVGQFGAIGDLAQVGEERGVMAGEGADFVNDCCGRNFQKHGEAFAETSPESGARGVVEERGGGGAGSLGEKGEFARVAIEDFGGACEGGAEMPSVWVKPIADGRERALSRGAGFSGEDGRFRRAWSSRGEDQGELGTHDVVSERSQGRFGDGTTKG